MLFVARHCRRRQNARGAVPRVRRDRGAERLVAAIHEVGTVAAVDVQIDVAGDQPGIGGVHNLGRLDWSQPDAAFDWTRRFDEDVADDGQYDDDAED